VVITNNNVLRKNETSLLLCSKRYSATQITKTATDASVCFDLER